MNQPKLRVVVENPADLADAVLLFERTAQALKAMLQMAKVMWEQDENHPDSDAIEQALERMAKRLLVIYPEGADRCIADQKTFQMVTIHPKSQN